MALEEEKKQMKAGGPIPIPVRSDAFTSCLCNLTLMRRVAVQDLVDIRSKTVMKNECKTVMLSRCVALPSR